MLHVDSPFWIAQVMTRDSRASEAGRLADVCEGESLATSNLVVGETWSFLRRREGHHRAMMWLDRLHETARVTLRRVTQEIEAEAWTRLRVHDERPYSFVDATSFALMRRLGIRDAMAFDGDFAAAGFTELQP